MSKERFYTTPSSLGSYFGVGFNSPQDQIQIDLGLIEPDFDDDAKSRMLLGKTLEDSVLNYYEEYLNIKITDRNTDMMYFYDGKIKGIMDGMTELNGVKTVVECKVSNSKSYKFTDNMGYILQCQAYMLATDTKQALLCGLYRGEPLYKLIERDEEIIQDIKDMTDFVVNVLIGLDDFSNYPDKILEKYSTIKILPEIETITKSEHEDLLDLIEYKKEEKELKAKIKKIEDNIKNNYDEGVFDNSDYKLTVSMHERKGSYDVIKMSIEHPEIDYEKYLKPSSSYKTMRITPKKKG